VATVVTDLIAATVVIAAIVATVVGRAATAIVTGISRPAMCRAPQSMCLSWTPPLRRETIADEHDPKRGEAPLLPPA